MKDLLYDVDTADNGAFKLLLRQCVLIGTPMAVQSHLCRKLLLKAVFPFRYAIEEPIDTQLLAVHLCAQVVEFQIGLLESDTERVAQRAAHLFWLADFTSIWLFPITSCERVATVNDAHAGRSHRFMHNEI